ncbi:hypothetical protein AXE80_12555 [Wenyingzhuangia fucanilytica]|uniref:Tetratricopeptide repeat protein n=1 Tax=Wenyingzhuangia fucanilytica TaxID=1790137 RepID=A0A1B1Y8H4_9FLAO|nr:hypothetical protein [Wenyingzhuangia fucanilytica]ANW97065.1 hypothetical protein AXE80_12555 [Wenyingzhuangia fucanilytica]
MQEFTQAIKSQNIETLNLETLENIADKFPYFQLNKTLLLKKYHQQEHFKYNNALKNVAAHTVNREILFEFITQIEETKPQEKISKIVDEQNITNEPLEANTPQEKIEQEVAQPFQFTHSEKHSFNQWLQISNPTPIKRKDSIEKNETEKVSNPKLKIINQFISNNPKISPIKKNTPIDSTTVANSNTDISNELMTETLAKVYLAQKKYENAIQAYKILSLKYPEKSSLFADQIQRIKILQNNKL